jgi:heptosyltransferase-3
MIFPEAGADNKMVNHEFWMRIINILVEKKDDSKIVICGLTEYSRELIIKLSRENCHEKIVNAIGKLSILQINSLLEKSRGAITLDSFPAHLASAQTQTLCLFKDGFGLEYLPINKFPVVVIHNHTPSKNIKDFRPNMNIGYISSFEDGDSFKDIIQGLENIFKLN